MAELQGTATVHLSDLISDNLESFLDRVAELAFGPEDCAAAVGVEFLVVGFTPDTVLFQVSADRDPNAGS